MRLLKRSVFCCILAVLILFCGCGEGAKLGREFAEAVNTVDGLYLDILDVNSTGATVFLINKSDITVYCGYDAVLSLQMEVDGKWYELDRPAEGNASYPGSIKVFPPNEYTAHSRTDYNCEPVYGELGAGHYRVVKNVWSDDNLAEYSRLVIAGEFYVE